MGLEELPAMAFVSAVLSDGEEVSAVQLRWRPNRGEDVEHGE